MSDATLLLERNSRAVGRRPRPGKRMDKPLGLSALHPVPENIVKSVVLARIGNLWTEEYLAYRQAIVVGALRSKDPGRPKPRSTAPDAPLFSEFVEIDVCQ